MILPIVFAVLIALAHYGSHHFCLVCTKIKDKLISFVAGVATVYIFMDLLPEFYSEATKISPVLYTSVFFGFAIFFLIDKEIYQKIQHKKVSEDIKLAHGVGIIVYYFVVGMALVQLLSVDMKQGILFFIPVFIYSGLSTLSGHGIHGMHGPHYEALSHIKLFQSLSVIAGTLVGLFVVIPNPIFVYLIGLVGGLLLYVIIRDTLPKGKKGKPYMYVTGAAIYTVLIIALSFI